MKKVALSAKNLCKSFGEGDSKTIAVNNVSFEALAGEMLFIVGPSGSGKTTLLSMISGILKPNAGKVVIDGCDLWNLSSNDLADYRLQKIGFVFQDYHLFPKLTTAENVAIPLILKRVEWNQALAVACDYLKVVGLDRKSEVNPNKLSGGEQQRVAIARAIASQPELLIFDEPTASLDGETGRRIIEFVKEKILTPNRCIIIVTHDSRIFEYADSMMKMEDGRVVEIERITREE